MKRLLVVYNPNSSQYRRVKSEVLQKLPGLKGYIVGKFEVKKSPFDENAKRLSKVLKDGDLVIVAGGDGTASVAANGIINSKKDAHLAILPYGNFNDFSRTLKVKNLDQALNNSKVINYYPLEIHVDGKLWRYAPNYITIGMTAESVAVFDDKKVRKNLQKGMTKIVPYKDLAKWYFKNRHKKTFIPKFKLNGEAKNPKTSDYAALNASYMARVMKGGEDYKDKHIFRSETDRLTNFCRLVKLMVKSMLIRTPGKETKGDTIEFEAPATVEAQTEGEYHTFTNINKIEIRKGASCLKMVARI